MEEIDTAQERRYEGERERREKEKSDIKTKKRKRRNKSTSYGRIYTHTATYV